MENNTNTFEKEVSRHYFPEYRKNFLQEAASGKMGFKGRLMAFFTPIDDMIAKHPATAILPPFMIGTGAFLFGHPLLSLAICGPIAAFYATTALTAERVNEIVREKLATEIKSGELTARYTKETGKTAENTITEQEEKGSLPAAGVICADFNTCTQDKVAEPSQAATLKPPTNAGTSTSPKI